MTISGRAAGAALLFAIMTGCGPVSCQGGVAIAQEQPPGITGAAVALDGDTLLIDGARVRLFGIDAPEMTAPDGWRSRAALDALLEDLGRAVDCTRIDTDRYGRAVAVCIAGGGDLAASMVRQGWAAVHRLYAYGSHDCDPALVDTYGKVDYAAAGCLGPVYDGQETIAREARSGRWAENFR